MLSARRGPLEVSKMFCRIKSRDRKEIGTSVMVGRRMFSSPFAENVARCSGNLGLLVVLRIGANCCVGLQRGALTIITGREIMLSKVR